METIYLMGSEDVERAAQKMKEAAAEMTMAANLIWEAQQRFEDNILRLEALR